MNLFQEIGGDILEIDSGIGEAIQELLYLGVVRLSGSFAFYSARSIEEEVFPTFGNFGHGFIGAGSCGFAIATDIERTTSTGEISTARAVFKGNIAGIGPELHLHTRGHLNGGDLAVFIGDGDQITSVLGFDGHLIAIHDSDLRIGIGHMMPDASKGRFETGDGAGDAIVGHRIGV